MCSSDGTLFVEVSMVIMIYHYVKRADRGVDARIWYTWVTFYCPCQTAACMSDSEEDTQKIPETHRKWKKRGDEQEEADAGVMTRPKG